MSQERFTIGFANQSEKSPFAVAVREHLEAVAAQYPDLELVVLDNDRNTETAKANVQTFLDIPVDVAILFHIDERAGNDLVMPLRYQRIPVITIDIPLSVATFVGTDIQSAGDSAGEVLAQWIQANWEGVVDKILIVTEQRALDIVQQRFTSALSAMDAIIGLDKGDILYVDGSGDPQIIAERTTDVLQSWAHLHRIAVLCISDDVAADVLDTARALDREGDIAVLSYDGTRVAIEEFQRPNSRLIVSPLLRADHYAQVLIDLALRYINGEDVPRRNLIPALCLTRDNFAEYV